MSDGISDMMIEEANECIKEPFPGRWERLESFVKDIQVNDQIGQEEKDMILNICKHENTKRTN